HPVFTAVFSSFLWLRLPPRLTLFPYTTLFRSGNGGRGGITTVHDVVEYFVLRQAQLFLDKVADPQVCLVWDQKVNVFRGFIVCRDRKSTRLNSSHVKISYAVFCLKKKTTQEFS